MQSFFFLTCKLSWTRSASLFAKADSRMLACSRSALWDWANPASFPFSCSSSSANFLLASSNFRIRFLKQRDSWSCGSNTCHWYKKLNNKTKHMNWIISEVQINCSYSCIIDEKVHEIISFFMNQLSSGTPNLSVYYQWLHSGIHT